MPVIFLIYVNDIPDIIMSTAKLFVDDTKIYRQINNIEDSIALQIDLTTLDLWTDRWQMKFNPTYRLASFHLQKGSSMSAAQ